MDVPNIKALKLIKMSTITRKWWFISITVIFVIIFLNPTYSNFKEFTGMAGSQAKYLHKKSNFLVCSIYEDDLHNESYFGFLKNFIQLKSEHTYSKGSVDSAAKEFKRPDTTDIKPEFDPSKPYEVIPDNYKYSAKEVIDNYYRNKSARNSLVLDEKYRLILDTVVITLETNNEPSAAIQYVVNDFKLKFGHKKF
ncbi:MAG: hypothetical protein C5B59_00940 [Bacteroidetes bacterium]|nr:MAG: hypothetical protein C5B59_00940 [Bacteroidota bacterium]